MDSPHETLAWAAGAVASAGALGGVLNALLTDNGFILPQKEQMPPPTGEGGAQLEILRPGFVVNVILGMTAGLLSWITTTNVATLDLFHLSAAADSSISLPLSALATSALIGVGGSRWLTSTVDKRLSQATNAVLATKQATSASSAVVSQIALASPVSALRMAQAMPSGTATSSSDANLPASEFADEPISGPYIPAALSDPTDADLDNTDH